MKLGLVFSVLALVACTGCAANPALQAQVADLQKTAARQDQQIEELSAAAAKCSGRRVAGDLATDASDLATAAWNWLSSEASDANRAAQHIVACYRAGSDDVHTFDQAQALMSRCYHAQQH